MNLFHKKSLIEFYKTNSMFSKKKNYIVNFKFENYENDFYHAFDEFELKNLT